MFIFRLKMILWDGLNLRREELVERFAKNSDFSAQVPWVGIKSKWREIIYDSISYHQENIKIIMIMKINNQYNPHFTTWYLISFVDKFYDSISCLFTWEDYEMVDWWRTVVVDDQEDHCVESKHFWSEQKLNSLMMIWCKLDLNDLMKMMQHLRRRWRCLQCMCLKYPKWLWPSKFIV